MAGHKPSILWSPEARADLIRIWDYYVSVAGIHTAEDIVSEIGKVCSVLEQHPLAGRSRSEVRPGLRCAVANPHIVFYRIKDGTAQIVRVLDERQDIDELFAH